MRQIIYGKMYDTDKAVPLAYIPKDGIEGIFYSYEILYQKIDGTFFLCLTVGSNPSMYNNPGDILPITEEEAKDWVAKNFDVEEYEKLFGSIE